jgi:hypothetical protein
MFNCLIFCPERVPPRVRVSHHICFISRTCSFPRILSTCINQSSLATATGVVAVNVTLVPNTATIDYHPPAVDHAHLVSLITALGFTAHLESDNEVAGDRAELAPETFAHRRTVLAVDGMHCCSCTGKIEVCSGPHSPRVTSSMSSLSSTLFRIPHLLDIRLLNITVVASVHCRRRIDIRDPVAKSRDCSLLDTRAFVHTHRAPH